MEAKPERLQKVLAAAGLASRRKAEELIAAGRVSVNGHVITEPGSKADPRLDEIRVDGKLLRGPERHVYLAMYKPKGYMTTVSDPEGRPTVMDVLKNVEERVFPVGRLDYMSEGLLLLTNDGELMAELTRAGSHVAKTYMVKVSGKPDDEAIEKLRNGIMLPPEPGLTGARGKKQPGVERRSFAVRTQPAEIQLAVDQENPWFEVTLTEGRNRQLRRMFEQIGHHIEKIKRIRYGSLTLDLEPGEFRHLTPKEVGQLRKSLKVPFKPKPISKPIKAKPKHARPERPDRASRLDSARFVKGRRGMPSAEPETTTQTDKPRRAAAGFSQRAAASESGRGFERRPFRGREDRPAGRGFGAPRGPEFPRRQRSEGRDSERDERYAAKRPHAKSGPGFESKFEKRGSAAKSDRRFSKGPGKPERDETRSREDFRGARGKPSGGPPEWKRDKFTRQGSPRGDFERGKFEHTKEPGPANRSRRPGKGFGTRPEGAAPGRPGRGGLKRPSGAGSQREGRREFRAGAEGGKRPGYQRPGFQRSGSQGPGSQRPGSRRPGQGQSGGRFGRPSGAAGGRPSSFRRGGPPRPPRRSPEEE